MNFRSIHSSCRQLIRFQRQIYHPTITCLLHFNTIFITQLLLLLLTITILRICYQAIGFHSRLINLFISLKTICHTWLIMLICKLLLHCIHCITQQCFQTIIYCQTTIIRGDSLAPPFPLLLFQISVHWQYQPRRFQQTLLTKSYAHQIKTLSSLTSLTIPLITTSRVISLIIATISMVAVIAMVFASSEVQPLQCCNKHLFCLNE